MSLKRHLFRNDPYHPRGLLAPRPPSTSLYSPTLIGSKYEGAAEVARAACHSLMLGSSDPSRLFLYERSITGPRLLAACSNVAVTNLK